MDTPVSVAATIVRIAALIEPTAESRSLAAIKQAWSAWLADYLSTHRCG